MKRARVHSNIAGGAQWSSIAWCSRARNRVGPGRREAPRFGRSAHVPAWETPQPPVPARPPAVGRTAMDHLLSVVLPICCGMDVHKKTVTACLLQTGASGEAVSEVRTFRTVTDQLQELARWLVAAGCRHVALESTGVYWKPVFNVLEQ